MPSGSFATFAWSRPASIPPPRFVLCRGSSRPTSAFSSSFRVWVISAGAASVSTCVEDDHPAEVPGARWSTKRTFSYVSWTVVFMARERMGGADTGCGEARAVGSARAGPGAVVQGLSNAEVTRRRGRSPHPVTNQMARVSRTWARERRRAVTSVALGSSLNTMARAQKITRRMRILVAALGLAGPHGSPVGTSSRRLLVTACLVALAPAFDVRADGVVAAGVIGTAASDAPELQPADDPDFEVSAVPPEIAHDAEVTATSNGVPPPAPRAITGIEPPTPGSGANVAGPSARRYGWQILAVDAGSVVIGLATMRGEVLVGGWLFGAPVVHALHRNTGGFFASFALHAVLPLAGAVVGSQMESCGSGSGEYCGLGGAVTGALVGMIAATTIDARVLAKERPPPPPGRFASVRLVPRVDVRDGHASIGVIGLY